MDTTRLLLFGTGMALGLAATPFRGLALAVARAWDDYDARVWLGLP